MFRFKKSADIVDITIRYYIIILGSDGGKGRSPSWDTHGTMVILATWVFRNGTSSNLDLR